MSNVSIEEAQELAVIRALCEEDLYFFIRWIFYQQSRKTWVRNWHHEKICQKLNDVYKYKSTRLVINIPPRYSKTEIVSVCFIAWSLMKNPSAKFIHISYNNELAQENASKVKEILESSEFQMLWPHIKISKESRSKKKWYIQDYKGGMFSVSAEMGITGFGAGSLYDSIDEDFLNGAIVIDDPVKINELKGTPEQVNNYLDKVNRNYVEVISNRVNSIHTPIIVIMQRVHENDLSGFLLAGCGGEDFELLKIPVQSDEYGALWPFKHSEEYINRVLKKQSSFSGQYMQDPKPDEANQVIKMKDFRRYRDRPSQETFVKTFLAMDTANKDKSYNDPSVIIYGAITESKDIYILDVWRKRAAYPELKNTVIAKYNDINPDAIIIEDKASGQQLIQELRDAGVSNIIAAPTDSNKVLRMQAQIEFITNGKVFLPEQADWLYDLEQEFSHFPKVKHDDQVDAFAHLLRYIKESDRGWLIV